MGVGRGWRGVLLLGSLLFCDLHTLREGRLEGEESNGGLVVLRADQRPLVSFHGPAHVVAHRLHLCLQSGESVAVEDIDVDGLSVLCQQYHAGVSASHGGGDEIFSQVHVLHPVVVFSEFVRRYALVSVALFLQHLSAGVERLCLENPDSVGHLDDIALRPHPHGDEECGNQG